MARTNMAKVEFYKLLIGLALDLIEEHTGSKLITIDASLDHRLECAIEYHNVKELKEVYLRLDEMLQNAKRRGIYALKYQDLTVSK